MGYEKSTRWLATYPGPKVLDVVEGRCVAME